MRQKQIEPDKQFTNAQIKKIFAPRCHLDGVKIAGAINSVDAVESLGVLLLEEAKRFRLGLSRFMIGLAVYGVIMITLQFLMGYERWSTNFPVLLTFSIAFSVLVLSTWFILVVVYNPRVRRQYLMTQLIEKVDVRSIGPLIDSLGIADERYTEIVKDALTQLLLQLGPGDSDILNDSHRARLCKVLETPLESTFHKDVRELLQPANEKAVKYRIAILRAFEQVGDKQALPIVTALAGKTPKTDGEQRIVEVANECLPLIHLRTEEAVKRNTLLRASQLPESDSLLRGVAGGSTSNPDELLRPLNLTLEQ